MARQKEASRLSVRVKEEIAALALSNYDIFLTKVKHRSQWIGHATPR